MGKIIALAAVFLVIGFGTADAVRINMFLPFHPHMNKSAVKEGPTERTESVQEPSLLPTLAMNVMQWVMMKRKDTVNNVAHHDAKVWTTMACPNDWTVMLKT